MISDSVLLEFVASLKTMGLEGQRTQYRLYEYALDDLHDAQQYLEIIEVLRITTQGREIEKKLSDAEVELTYLVTKLRSFIAKNEYRVAKNEYGSAVEENCNHLLEL